MVFPLIFAFFISIAPEGISVMTDISRMMLMRRLKPEDRWRMECMYDGPIPIEVIENKIASYKDGDPDLDNAYGYKGATEDPRNVVDGEDLEIWERWNK